MSLRLGWFSTGRDEAARLLLTAIWQAIQKEELVAQIGFVFSNREPGESAQSNLFLGLAQSYGLPVISFSSRSFPFIYQERLVYDQEVMKRLEPYPFDLGVLAGYMRIVGEEMSSRYRLINLHPASPGGPTGTWQEVIWKLIEAGAEETGVMMHLVTPELDKGLPVTYCRFPIRSGPFDLLWREIKELSVAEIKARQGESNALFQEIRRQGMTRELPLMVATLLAFSQRRVWVEGGKVVDADGRTIAGYDLTDEIEEMVKGELAEAAQGSAPA